MVDATSIYMVRTSYLETRIKGSKASWHNDPVEIYSLIGKQLQKRGTFDSVFGIYWNSVSFNFQSIYSLPPSAIKQLLCCVLNKKGKVLCWDVTPRYFSILSWLYAQEKIRLATIIQILSQHTRNILCKCQINQLCSAVSDFWNVYNYFSKNSFFRQLFSFLYKIKLLEHKVKMAISGKLFVTFHSIKLSFRKARYNQH